MPRQVRVTISDTPAAVAQPQRTPEAVNRYYGVYNNRDVQCECVCVQDRTVPPASWQRHVDQRVQLPSRRPVGAWVCSAVMCTTLTTRRRLDTNVSPIAMLE
jgi:hypothetical protein